MKVAGIDVGRLLVERNGAEGKFSTNGQGRLQGTDHDGVGFRLEDESHRRVGPELAVPHHPGSNHSVGHTVRDDEEVQRAVTARGQLGLHDDSTDQLQPPRGPELLGGAIEVASDYPLLPPPAHDRSHGVQRTLVACVGDSDFAVEVAGGSDQPPFADRPDQFRGEPAFQLRPCVDVILTMVA